MFTHLRTLILLLLFCVGKSSLAFSGSPRKVIGIHPLVEVKADGSNVDPIFRPYLDAFGVINLGSASCTGTHLGNGYVLTAGHCFMSQSVDPANPWSVTNQDCPGVTVTWGYRGSPATGSARPVITLTSNCTNLIYAERSSERDFAIFQVDRAPTVSIPLQTPKKETDSGTQLTIFGFPNGSPLNWSQYCPLVTLDQVPDLQKDYKPGRILYQCDTLPGSSGSPVIAVKNGSISLAGVHNDAAAQSIPYNIGTDFYDIYQALLIQGFDLVQAAPISFSNWEGFW